MAEFSTADDGVIEFIEHVQTWHARMTAQLSEIVNNKGASIQVGDKLIAADSDIAKGIRFGVGLSLDMLGELPFKVDRNG
jgi:hypothetical protein